MTTFKEIQAYYDALKVAFQSKQESNTFNNDRSHNATVLRFMLDNSKAIKMYCGELSVFRQGFYDYVEKNAEQGDGVKIMDAMSESLRTFLAKDDTHLTIIVENYTPELLKDVVVDEFAEAVKNGQVELRQLGDDLSFKKVLNHFTVTDSKIVRAEQSKEEHSAVCTMHDDVYYQMIDRSFDKLYLLSNQYKNL